MPRRSAVVLEVWRVNWAWDEDAATNARKIRAGRMGTVCGMDEEGSKCLAVVRLVLSHPWRDETAP
jgi:hypothetical protein